MLVRTTTPILDYEGNPILTKSLPNGQPDPASPPTQLRDLVYRALNNYEQDEKPNAEESTRRYRITAAFFAGPTIDDLSIEDAAFIKEKSGRLLAPLAHGRLCDELERAAQGVGTLTESPAETPEVD